MEALLSSVKIKQGDTMSDLEKQILNISKNAIADAIQNELVGYNKPLSKMANEVVLENKQEVKSIMDESFKSVIRSAGFDTMVKEEFNRKIAKLLVGQLSGEVEKAVNTFRQDPTLKAKMILAIEKIIN